MSDDHVFNWNLAVLSARAGSDVVRVRDGHAYVTGVCSLAPGRHGALAFADAGVDRDAIAQTSATALVTTPAQAEWTDKPVVICDDPRSAFAAMTAVFAPADPLPGVAASAELASDAIVASSVSIQPGVVVGNRTTVADDSIVGPNAVIGDDVVIGRNCRVGAGTVLEFGVRLGDEVVIGSNAVLGARGFGLVQTGSGWSDVPQLGSVWVGDQVEIGAGTTIDRGTLDDTTIHASVRIDNQVHIGHNVVVGERTVLAGCVAIAGSVDIGADCLLGGGVSIADHVAIGDGVWLTGGTQVPNNLPTSGVYSSTLKATPVRIWRRCLAGLRRLDKLERRLRRLEAGNSANKDI